MDAIDRSALATARPRILLRGPHELAALTVPRCSWPLIIASPAGYLSYRGRRNTLLAVAHNRTARYCANGF